MEKEYFEISVLKGPLEGQVFKISESVTYITGANGSGKTQLFEAIKSGAINLEKNPDKAEKPTWVAVEWLNEHVDDIGSQAKPRPKAKPRPQRQYTYEELRDLMDEMDQILPKVIAIPDSEQEAKIGSDGGYSLETVQKKDIKHHGLPFNEKAISKGTTALLEAFNWNGDGGIYPGANRRFLNGPLISRMSLIELKKKAELGNSLNFPSMVVYLWDEPEIHLHPKEQRKLSMRFNQWIKKIKDEHKNTMIVVLVATHSPFALTGASEYGHEIICLDKCRIVKQSLDKNNHADIKLEANKLLGLGMSDVIPTRMVIAETSLVKLITSLAEKFGFKSDHLDITSGGDGNAITKVKDMASILNLLKSVSSQWPHRDIFNLNITLILDDEKALEHANNISLGNTIDLEFFKIGKSELEDSYPLKLIDEFLSNDPELPSKWDKNKFSTFKKLLKQIDHTRLGTIKFELAKYIASRIDDLDHLEKSIPEAYRVLVSLYKLKGAE